MSKLQDIRELAQEHATLVSSSPRDWMGYMDTAARLSPVFLLQTSY